MNKEQPIDSASLKKLTVIMAVVVLMVFLALWGLMYVMGYDSARRFTSYFQSGTQVFFDEGRFGKELYGAKVSAYNSGQQVLFGGQNFVKGSTLPDSNETNQYPVVAAAGVSFKRGLHYGSVTNELFQSKNTPALILHPGGSNFSDRQGLSVQTLNENISPYAGENYRLKQATHVHVHTGQSSTLRGSTACLTIDPEQARVFFESEIGETGVVHISR